MMKLHRHKESKCAVCLWVLVPGLAEAKMDVRAFNVAIIPYELNEKNWILI